MRTIALLLVFVVSIAIAGKAHTARPYCLEQLTREYKYNDTIWRHYKPTGEFACFSLKVHVARCLDKSMLRWVEVMRPHDITDASHPPKVELSTVKSVIMHDIQNERVRDAMTELLDKCAHYEDVKGASIPVIQVGDFTKRCECDFGSYMDCFFYEHARTMYGCGPTEHYDPIESL